MFFSISILGACNYFSSLLIYSSFKRPRIKFNYYIFIIFIPILTSLAPLLTDLLWKVYELNTINFNSNYYLLSSLLVVIIFQWFNYITISKITCLIVFILLQLNNYLFGLALLIFFSALKLDKFNKIHLIIILYLYTSWASNNYIVNYWTSDIYYNNIAHINLSLVKHPLFIRSESNDLYESTYSILSDFSTALNSGIFFLHHNISEYQQIFLSDNTRITLMSKTFDDLTFLIPLCTYIIFSYMCRLLGTSYIIKC